MLKKFPLISSFECFIMKSVLDFVKSFSSSTEMIMVFPPRPPLLVFLATRSNYLSLCICIIYVL